MSQWIVENFGFLSFGVQMSTLVIWALYLHLFFRSHRRQTRPKVIINRGAGAELNASCFIANMGSEPIYIESIIASLRSNGDSWEEAVTDVTSLDGAERDAKSSTHQGPLRSAQYMDIGSFRDLALRVLDGANPEEGAPAKPAKKLDALQEPVEFVVKVIADHASDDRLIGAERTFQLTIEEDGWSMSAQDIQTRQIRSRAERRHIEHLLSKEA